MRVAIHQPYHLPWLAFFHKMWMSDVFVLLDNVPYSKNDFQNRNRIRTSGTDKGWCLLTVPVLTKGRFGQRINQVEINKADKAWNRRCWRSIEYSYSQAEYFENYQDFFYDLYTAKSWDKLVDLNVYLIEYLTQVLGMDTELVLASDLGVSGSSTELLLGICQKLGADLYISGRFGRDYLDEAQFHQQGIQVVYQDFQHPEYPQVYEPFVPNMSVIDLVFNCGDKSKEIICPG
jgi:hypothetical protein